MKAVIQRVKSAKVTVQDSETGHEQTTGEINAGLLVLLGVGPNDSEVQAQWLAKKITGLRIFEDEAGKMNLSVKDIQGAILAVSQFTLYGDCKRGRRPSFVGAAHPDLALPLFNRFVDLIKLEGIDCGIGKFGHHMEVSLINDGPVTLILDTDELMK